MRAGLPLLLPTGLIGMSFGVLAEPVMGKVAPVVMSIVVFAGSAQFASLSALASGAGAATAIGLGVLMNLRFLPMGFAVAPALKGGPLRRAAEGQTVVDASWAIAHEGEGRFDRQLLLGATIPQAAGWMGGTLAGVLFGDALGDPETLGLDAMFPAFFLALLVDELRKQRGALPVALLGAAVALALLPVAPPGIPVLAAAGAALIGLRRS